MTVLLPEQADALRQLQGICQALDVDVVVIGATAFRVWLPDAGRMTEDVDVAVALDLGEFPQLTTRLGALGWREDPRHEQRWHSPLKARVDLLPLGARARREKQIVWPRAETRMRVVGYDHVFQKAVASELAPGLTLRVAPLVVLALLKMVSYVDSPRTRQKDLGDVLTIVRTYEESNDRRFNDEILDSGLEYDEAGAYLLGRDLRALCASAEEVEAVHRFLERVNDRDFLVPVIVLPPTNGESEGPFVQACAALARGFGGESRASP
jgi:predicted nucleotidyltransferase